MATSPLLLFLLLAAAAASAQDCNSSPPTSPSTSKPLSNCVALSSLSAVLHWTHYPSSGTAEVAFRAPLPSSSGWIAWGLNPVKSGMEGTQAVVGVRLANGSLDAFTANVQSKTDLLQPGELTYKVNRLTVLFDGRVMTISGTLSLPGNWTEFSHTWQSSSSLANGRPASHATSGDNLKSAGRLNLTSGSSTTVNAIPRIHRENLHGVLNAVSWGILMPIGFIIARYLKLFESADPAWFYLHVTCQLSAYILGVAGWGLGLDLGSKTPGIPDSNKAHRSIGIVLFCFATLQVFALILRPHKDSKYRFYWNVYHRSVGYSVIILSIVNIFKGFDILEPERKWKRAYSGVIIALVVIVAILEAFKWIATLRRRSRRSAKAAAGGAANGYTRSVGA